MMEDRYSAARAHMHQAVQLITKAARANLDAAPDDSHSSLEWDAASQSLVSQEVKNNANHHLRLGLQPASLTLTLHKDGNLTEQLDLKGETVEGAQSWLDAKLAAEKLNLMSSIVLPYDLPDDANRIAAFAARTDENFTQLAAWYDIAAEALASFAKSKANLSPGPSPVRCWPHHFDIASYVSLEPGNPETAKGVGVGMSPGDNYYDQPYFYINPWPRLAADGLPAAPQHAHWHTKDFVGLVAPVSKFNAGDSRREEVCTFVGKAFEIAHGALNRS